jgi:hypothetical protein
MDIYRPLRVILFVYELLRLVILMVLGFTPVTPLTFPWPMYAVPNALFPLMALFLLLSPPVYRVYLPLYVAGKAIALSAALGWYLSWVLTKPLPVFLNPELVFGMLGGMVFFFLGDALSAFFAFRLDRRIKEVTADGPASDPADSPDAERGL